MRHQNPIFLTFLLLTSLLLPACKNSQTVIPETDKLLPKPISPTASLTADELIAKYNDNIKPIDYLRASATFDLKYVDEEKETHHENGSGNFYFQRPLDMTLVLKKAGIEIFWAGSNPDLYWLFDLHNDELFYGYHKFASDPNTLRLSIPIQPQDVTALIGFKTLNEELEGMRAPLKYINGYSVLDQNNFRYYINPDTGLPARIDYLDPITQIPVVASLLTHGKSYTDTKPSPKLPARADIYAINADAYLKLYLHDYTHRKPNEKLFDLNRMIKVHKPNKVMQLDQAIPGAEPISNQ
ncbi:hypothetical protein JD969_16725 [Planctomycetota bacterium]|nr:hypothetical protein JD969_16725 [Planctomycetota bacterium]